MTTARRAATAGEVLAVAAGGAAGSVARVLVAVPAGGVVDVDPAAATLVVNVLGSFVIGVVAGRCRRPPAWLTTGVLGGFTTFSGWVVDVARLWPGSPGWAVALVLAAPALSVAACLAGRRVAR